MNIAIIPSADLNYNSGSVIYAKNLFKFLINKNHNVFMLGSKIPEDMNDKYINNIFIKSKILEHPVIDDREISNKEYYEMIKEIIDFILEVDSCCDGLDVICAQYASVNSFAAIIASVLLDIPVVVESFGRDLNVGFEKDLRIRKMGEISLMYSDFIIAADKSIEEKIKLVLHGTNKYISVIGMPMDLTIKEAGSLFIDKGNDFIITSVNSCFSEEKGIELIINAFEKIHNEFPRTKLYIAGTDDHPQKIHEKKLLKVVQQKKLEDNIIFTGFLSRKDVGNLLKKSDIYIDARNNGNFSSVLLEAMYMGVPIIASENTGSLKVITTNKNGVLFKKNNTEEIYKKIKELIENEELRKLLSLNGKEYLERHKEKYMPDECFSKVETVLEKTILNHKRKKEGIQLW